MLPSSDPLFDEQAADAEVMRSLYKTVSKLRKETIMSKVIKSSDGKYYVGEFEEISPEAVTEMIAKKQQQLQELESIAPAAAPDNGGQDNGQAAPADGGQPSTDNAGTPSGDGSAPAAPAADPNAAPAGEAPAAPTQPANDQGQVADPNAAAPAQPQAPTLQ